VTEPLDSAHQSSLDRLKSFKASDFSSRYALYIGRILSGIGIASGTDNAWLAELVGKEDSTRAAIIGTSTNFLGLGLAALLSGLLGQYAPWPLQLSFIVYLVLLCAAAVLVWFTPETVDHPDPSHLEIRPRLSLPREIRAQFVAPAITGFGLMALVGFYASRMVARAISREIGRQSAAWRTLIKSAARAHTSSRPNLR